MQCGLLVAVCRKKYAHNPKLSCGEQCVMQHCLHLLIDYATIAVHGHRLFRACDDGSFLCIIAMLRCVASLKQGTRMGFTIVVCL